MIRAHRNRDVITVAGLAIIGCFVIAVLAWLNGCTPEEQQHRIQEGQQQIDLASCREQARVMDASAADKWASYTKCADEADRIAGKDGG